MNLPSFIYLDTAFSEQWGLFTLLCELFSRVLFTMGDDEFFDESKNPLKLSEIINMSICMKVLMIISIISLLKLLD